MFGVVTDIDDVAFLEAFLDRVAYQHFLETYDSKSFYSIKDPGNDLYQALFTPLNHAHTEDPATNIDSLIAELTDGADLPPCSEDELKRKLSGHSA